MMQNILLGFEAFLGLGVIIAVYMQPSKADALSGLIQGSTQETFFAKNKSRTKESILIRLTILFAALFAINTVILNLVK
jgi:preprotein translocase subunit SecG